MKKLTGSICALATPFQGGALDFEAFGRLIEYQLAGGTEAIVVAGSTGEAHALEDGEYDRLLAFAVERIAHRVPVLAGTGGANTGKTIRVTRRAQALGVDAALVVAPYYVRPTQEGLLRHYSEIAERGGLPVILYNVPARTACDILPETVAQLAVHKNIVGIKEARSDAERMTTLLEYRSSHFSILSGDDAVAMSAILAGADGVISVAANPAPKLLRTLCDLSRAGSTVEAQALNARLEPLYQLLGVEPNPIPVKWCLYLLGIGVPELRLPLLPLSVVHQSRAQSVLETLGFPTAVQPRHSSAA